MSALPQTDNRSSVQPRHPLDEVYGCGFDPLGKSLKECREHWKRCANAECKRVLAFHEAMRRRFSK